MCGEAGYRGTAGSIRTHVAGFLVSHAGTPMAAPRTPVNILIVEDDAIVRDWLHTALAGSEFAVVGDAATAADALILARRRRVDVVVLDEDLPDTTGVALVPELRAAAPRAGILLMSARPEPGLNERASRAGVSGTVVKTGDRHVVVGAIRSVAAGAGRLDPRHPPRRPTGPMLSPRERSVLRLIAGGRTNLEIASELEISEQTVKTLVRRAFTKLGVHRRAEAVAAATARGML